MAAVYKHVQDWKGNVDSEGVRNYTVIWHVHTDDQNDGALVVTDIDFMPEAELYVSTYDVGNESDPTAVCVGVDPQRMTDSLVDWVVTITYSSKPLGEGQTAIDSGSGEPTLPENPGEGNNNILPDARPWVIKFGSTKSTKLLTEDYSVPPKEVVNSAGVPFDPPISVEVSRVTISITLFKAFANWTFQKIRDYENRVNSDVWLGFPAETLRVTDYGAESIFDNGIYVWQIHLGFEYEPDGWLPVKVLDAGCHQKRSSVDDELVAIVDKQGSPITSPVPLDGFGKRLLAGSDLVFLEFKGYETKAFANIV